MLARFIRVWLAALISSLLMFSVANGQEQQPQSQRGDDALEVMQVFNQQAAEQAKANKLTDEEKHKILFFMGLGLLILLCVTAYLGVSMVVFNKQVFVPHMISAGLTVTLGLAHAVAAVVWFFPF